MSDILGTLLFVGLCAILMYTYCVEFIHPTKTESFGALQSLHSNDGIQDAYLTIENDPYLYYDPYGYWRGITWNLPTRNLQSLTYYPYLYERYIDRFGTNYPYW